MYTRRRFCTLALGTLPWAVAPTRINSKVRGIQWGLQSYSFTGSPMDGILDVVIEAMVNAGLGECDIYSPRSNHRNSPRRSAAARGESAGARHPPRPERPIRAHGLANNWRRGVPRRRSPISVTSARSSTGQVSTSGDIAVPLAVHGRGDRAHVRDREGDGGQLRDHERDALASAANRTDRREARDSGGIPGPPEHELHGP